MKLPNVLIAALLALASLPAPAKTPPEPIIGRASVIDGDTFEIRGQKIRVWGVDTPESKQFCYDAAGNAWRCGTTAANALADFIGVRTVTCAKRGKSYDRIVARCSVAGVDIGDWLVRSGWALAYRQYSKDSYVEAESEAMRWDRGIHASTFIPPWDFRRRKH